MTIGIKQKHISTRVDDPQKFIHEAMPKYLSELWQGGILHMNAGNISQDNHIFVFLLFTFSRNHKWSNIVFSMLIPYD